MLRRILLACVSLFLVLVLTETHSWAIYNCYDYVFFRLTGKDAHPVTASNISPDIAKYWPGCIVPINGLACVEEVMRQKGTYAGSRPMHTSQPLPHLAPGDVIYLPIGHIVYVEDYNYSKDPNADMTPRDAPILSHWLPIPGNYYGVEHTTIDVKMVEFHKYGMLNSTAERAGGFSYRDTFKILLVKEHMTETGYDLYKKLRLDVIIEVRDRNGKPLRDALIVLDGKTYKTGDKGRIFVELEPGKYRDRDLPFAIRKAGFKDEKRSLMAFQMKPSADFIVYPVDLEPVDLTELMNKLNYQLAEKRSKLERACLELINLNEERINAVGGLKAPTGSAPGDKSNMQSWMEAQEKLYKSASRDCGGLKGQRQTLKSLIAAVERDQARIETQMSQAEGMKCESKSDLARLESLDAQIVRTAWDIHYNQNKAYPVHQSITRTLWDVDNLYTKSSPLDPFLAFALPEATAPEDRLKWLQRFRDERFTKAYLNVQKIRADCVQAHHDAGVEVTSAAAGLATQSSAGGPLVPDSRASEFWRSARNMSPRPGRPCDEDGIKRDVDYALKQYTDLMAYLPPHRARVAKLKAACATTAADRDLYERLMKSYKSLSVYNDRRDKLLKVIADCRTALSKTPSPTGTPPKAAPPSVHVNMRVDGPTEAFVGDRMDFKAVILDKRYASDILRPDGAYAMYWYVDGKRRGDMQYYSDTVNFHAATVGTHTLKVEFVWGNPKTGNVRPIGWASKQVTIKKKESQDYANVNVPHGKWVKTGLSVKKGDVFQIEAKGAYTTKDGGKIGPEGGGRWGWWTLTARYGKKGQAVGRWGTFVADDDGVLELATPRSGIGDTFHPGDIENLTGELTVRVTVKRKTP